MLLPLLVSSKAPAHSLPLLTPFCTGGVVGGIALLLVIVLVVLFLWRRQRITKTQKEHVNLLQAGEGDGPSASHQLPAFYEPEPFLVPDPTASRRASSSYQGNMLEAGAGGRASEERSHSRLSGSGSPDIPGGSTTASTRKSGGGFMRPMRLVNIIQHDDAGPSESGVKEEEEPETIELPPAYTNIKK